MPDNDGYMTIGQLARATGLTVRALQLYDHKGLLKPARRNDANQRLYAPDQVNQVYRIQVLKYLGLSLGEVAEDADDLSNVDNLRTLVEEEQEQIVEDLKTTFSRIGTLMSLNVRLSEVPDGEDVPWADLVRTFEASQAGVVRASTTPAGDVRVTSSEGRAELASAAALTDAAALTGAIATASTAAPATAASDDAFKSFHEIVARAIVLMNSKTPPDSPKAKELAEQYLQFARANTADDLHKQTNFLEMAAPHDRVPMFRNLRKRVTAYLEQCVAAVSEADDTRSM